MVFDQLQLCYHRRAIDGNLRPHVPIRMSDGLRGRLRAHLVQAAFPKRPPRGGQDDLCRLFRPLKIKNLENGVVLGVHGQKRRAPGPHLVNHDAARAHQGFLVGESDGRALSNGGERGRKPGGADEIRHDEIDGPFRRLDDRLLSGLSLDPRSPQRLLQIAVIFLVGDNGGPGPRVLACRASSRTRVPAVSASTWKASGFRLIKSMVEHPTDPVDPDGHSLRIASFVSKPAMSEAISNPWLPTRPSPIRVIRQTHPPPTVRPPDPGCRHDRA